MKFAIPETRWTRRIIFQLNTRGFAVVVLPGLYEPKPRGYCTSGFALYFREAPVFWGGVNENITE